MDFLGYTFTPAGYIDLLVHYVSAGAAVGVLVVLLHLFHLGREH